MGPVAEPALSFGGLLRQLRDDAGLTQEELAEAARLSARSVSDLERGVNLTARHDTARLLAGALGLSGPQRALFEAAARGRLPAGEVLAAGEAAAAAAATRTLPRDIASFTGRGGRAGPAGRRGDQRGRGRGGGGGDPRDRRDGRDRQDDLRGARGAPAGRRFPGRAVFPAAARPHAGPAAGRPGRCAGQLAADRRGRRAADPARAGGPSRAMAGLPGREEGAAAAG